MLTGPIATNSKHGSNLFYDLQKNFNHMYSITKYVGLPPHMMLSTSSNTFFFNLRCKF